MSLSGVVGPKGRYPFRIGTTSYIIPEDIIPNVRVLAPLVDDVELLIFESDEISNLPDDVVLAELRRIASEYDLSYTVHLPIDIRLGAEDESERLSSVQKCLRVMERMDGVSPFAYVLHFSNTSFVAMDEMSGAQWDLWLSQIDKSISDLVGAGVAAESLCIETLSYDFGRVFPIVEKHGLSICLDIGHIIMYGGSVEEYLERYLERTRIFHVHGIKSGKDHASLKYLDKGVLSVILDLLCREGERQRVMTVEVFSEADFVGSCGCLPA
jgi:sugar phosphate isomerase/epimerase